MLENIILPLQMKIDRASVDLLKLVNNNRVLLCKKKNRPALAYIMWKWDRLMHSGRLIEDETSEYAELRRLNNIAEDDDDAIDRIYEAIDFAGSCENNPKYEIEEHIKGTDSQNDIIYDAWGIGVSNDGYGYETFANFYSDAVQTVLNDDGSKTPTMTFEDWEKRLKGMLDWEGKRVRTYLFFCIGTGLRLHKGYLVEKGPSGKPDHDYAGFTKMKDNLPVEIRDAFFEIINRPECHEVIEIAMKHSFAYGEIRKMRERIQGFLVLQSMIKNLMSKRPEMFEGLDTSKYQELLNLNLTQKQLDKYSRDGAIEEIKKIYALFEGCEDMEEVILDHLVAKNPDAAEKVNEINEEEDEDKVVYQFSSEYSPIIQYKKFHPSYRPHLIKAAQEYIEDGLSVLPECNDYLKGEHEIGLKVCTELLEYFENLKD